MNFFYYESKLKKMRGVGWERGRGEGGARVNDFFFLKQTNLKKEKKKKENFRWAGGGGGWGGGG